MNILSYVHLRNLYRSTGVGRVARELTQHLAARSDVHLEVLADRNDYMQVIDKLGPAWQNYRYHFFERDTSRQQAIWFLTNRPTAEAFWPEVDIVHCTAESYVPVKRAHLVVSCHDAQHFEPGVHRVDPWLIKQRLKWRLLFDRLAKSADVFHMISHFAAERTAHFFPLIKDRLHVIPNAASESFFAPPTEIGSAVLTHLGIENRPYIFVPGGLHHRKNADLILEAWPHISQLHPDVRLVIANHSADNYIKRARTLGPSVCIAGYQEEPQLVALYNSSQLVWFPTRYDGFGLPVIEAMASGAPVVSSNTTGIPEVAGTAGVLLSPDKPFEHVEAIDELLKNATERMRLSAMGRQRATLYRWSNSSDQLARTFAAIL